jgi:hypothetical protein
MSKTTLTEVVYVTNRILGPSLYGKYYFVRKAKDLGNGMLEVVGAKVDVTESVRALLTAERARAKARRGQGA